MNAYPERPNMISSNDAQKNNRYDTILEYFQNDSTIVYAFVVIFLAHFVLDRFGFLPLSLPRALWNILVYMTPSRILVALDPKRKASENESNDQDISLMNDNFEAKSEAMHRVLRLGNNNNNNNNNNIITSPPSPSSPSFSSLFSPAKAFSGIVGNALLGGGSRSNLPPGLGNWDNSCYQNSIIQGLASLRSLAAFLDRNVTALADGDSLSTHQALRDITERLNSHSNRDKKLWTPTELKSMSSWQQQDAQEYFAKIVEEIDGEILQVARRQTSNLGLKVAGPGEHVVGAAPNNGKIEKEAWTRMVAEDSSVRNPLEGLLAQRVGCMRCGWTEGLSLIPFNCLTVPLGGNWACNIQECLDQYMDLESIEGVECAKCTLLRVRDQLRNLLGQVEGDGKENSTSEQSPELLGALKNSAQSRLQAVEGALEEEDFEDKTLSKKCCVSKSSRVSTTKSRQAVIARAPRCLVIHINRSLFDETTGMLTKNYAEVRFPRNLDLSEWCLGTQSVEQTEGIVEKWNTNPKESMLPRSGTTVNVDGRQYELRALITHYGRHENGHYICYRKYPTGTFQAHVPEAVLAADGEKERPERWFRLSDDDVQMVSEQYVMSQGGGFMLFYEAVESPSSSPSPSSNSVDVKDPTLVDLQQQRNNLASSSYSATPDNMSFASTDALTQDDTDSSASRTPSVSPPAPDRVIPPVEEVDYPKSNMESDDCQDADGMPWSSSSFVTTM